MTEHPSPSAPTAITAAARLPLSGTGQGVLAAAPERRWQDKVLIALALVALFLPPLLTDSKYRLPIYGECLALAILALGVDLIWGYTGLLSLGQGLYFCMGAYAMAYSLTLQYAANAAGTPDQLVPPGFMNYTGLVPTHPNYVVPPALAYIGPLKNIWVALSVAVLLPMLFAAIFGWITFRLRIGGVYFSLITQALVAGFFILVLNQQPITGGVVGFIEVAELKLFGFTFKEYSQLYYLIAAVLVVCFIGCALLVRSKVGKLLTAVRDNENRVLALGYNTALYKTFAFTLAAGLAGLGGALLVPIKGNMGPTFLDVPFSIEVVVFVAIGGRGSLTGAILGTVLVRMAYSDLAVAFPDWWPIILGAVFIGVVVLLPRGLIVLAGQGGLLGILLGVAFLQPVEELLKTVVPGNDLIWTGDKLGKAVRLIGILLFLVGMIFVPKLIGLAGRALARLMGRKSAAGTPAFAAATPLLAPDGGAAIVPAAALGESKNGDKTRIKS